MKAYNILLILALLGICSSCGTSLLYRRQTKKMAIAMRNADSIRLYSHNNFKTAEIKAIADNSRYTITKYLPPDSLGHQAIDYTIQVNKDVTEDVNSMVAQTETAHVQEIHTQTITDNSQIHTKEEYEEPPIVGWTKHIKGIMALLLVIYLIYKFKK